MLVHDDVKLLIVALMTVSLAAPAVAQVVAAPAKSDRDAVQHGAQPNASEVRPGNREGDSPSAAAGELVPKPDRRILGLPVNAALLIAGLLVGLAIVAGIVIPGASRRRRARGGGTYGDPDPRARR